MFKSATGKLKGLLSFGKSAPIEKKSATLESLIGSFLNTSQLTAHTPSGALRLYRQSSPVSIVINKIARKAQQLRPVILTDSGKNVETSHAILDLLDNPSPEWNRSRFMESLFINFLVTETFYIWAGGNVNRPPLEMAPVNVDSVTINDSGQDIPLSYQINQGPYQGVFKRTEARVGGKRTVRYLNGNMAELHVVRGVDTKTSSGLHPQSRLTPIQDEINQVLQANKHNLAMLENGGRLSLLFTLKGDISDGSFEDARTTIMDKYSGSGAAGSIGVVSGDDTTVQEFGISPKDMDFKSMQETAILRVAQEYDIPGVLVLNDSATFNNMAEAREMMWDDAIIPVVRSVYEGIEDFLVMRFGLQDADIDLWFDEIRVPALRMRRITEVQARRTANVETINELRPILGRDDDVDGGDVIYQAATLIPVGQSTLTDPGRDIVKPSDDG